MAVKNEKGYSTTTIRHETQAIKLEPHRKIQRLFCLCNRCSTKGSTAHIVQHLHSLFCLSSQTLDAGYASILWYCPGLCMAPGEQALPLHTLWSRLWTYSHMPQTLGLVGPEPRHPCTQCIVSVLLACDTRVGTCADVPQAAQSEL